MSGQVSITAKDVRKTFGLGEAEVIALDDLNVTLHCGEMTLVKGPSGSGTSTIRGSNGPSRP